MPDAAQFWDKMAKRYAAKPIADMEAYERKLDLTREVLTPSMTVLEIGCGTGSTAIRLAPCVARIDAIDISSEMLQIATERAQDAGVNNLHFHQSSIQKWTPSDQKYDVILAHSILHLLNDLEATIITLRALLKPDGLFISNTACIAEINPVIRALLPIGGRLGLIPRLNIFSRAHLETTIENLGFDLSYIWPVKHGLFLIAKKSNTAGQNEA